MVIQIKKKKNWRGCITQTYCSLLSMKLIQQIVTWVSLTDSACFQWMFVETNNAFPLPFYWYRVLFCSLQIVPYFGLLFSCFEMCKQVCLYRNGYIISPLSYKLTPGVDQSLGPYELQEFKRYLRNRKSHKAQSSSIGNRW